MSKDLNKVQLIGRLGADPETRYTPQGSAITKLRIATSRGWRTAEGEDRDETEWTNVVAWNKLAEICAQYLRKGARVYIEGRLQTRSWDDQESGQKRYMTEVVANDMIMLDSRRDSMGGGGGYEEQDVGYQDSEPEGEPARQYAPRAESRAPQQPARAMNNENGAPTRPAPRPAPSNGAPRRPVAPTNDDDDLPF
jgi:single-strand DNA-binding protein